MNSLRELLRDADPIRNEPALPRSERDARRQAILDAVSRVPPLARPARRSRGAVFAAAVLMALIAAGLVGLLWSLYGGTLQAAIRFEVRLAEIHPGPGLHKARVAGSDRWVYLHDEVIVSNGDIAAARVVPGAGGSRYGVSVKFNAAGAKKMRAATQKNLGKPLAILLDGRVVMAPVIRSAIGGAAVITGNYTRAQAETIVKGIEVQ